MIHIQYCFSFIRTYHKIPWYQGHTHTPKKRGSATAWYNLSHWSLAHTQWQIYRKFSVEVKSQRRKQSLHTQASQFSWEQAGEFVAMKWNDQLSRFKIPSRIWLKSLKQHDSRGSCSASTMWVPIHIPQAVLISPLKVETMSLEERRG